MLTKASIIKIIIMITITVFIVWLKDVLVMPQETNYKFIIEYLKVLQMILNVILNATW